MKFRFEQPISVFKVNKVSQNIVRRLDQLESVKSTFSAPALSLNSFRWEIQFVSAIELSVIWRQELEESDHNNVSLTWRAAATGIRTALEIETFDPKADEPDTDCHEPDLLRKQEPKGLGIGQVSCFALYLGFLFYFELGGDFAGGCCWLHQLLHSSQT